jgi:ankyrin repeat protein
VAGERVDALRLLLAHVSTSLVNGARTLHDAAARVNVAMVEMLLEQGTDASSIAAGRWVLDPELAPLLARAGAGADRSGAWIGLACTGNQGRKDDPEFVAALLRYGARADDRRHVGQEHNGGRATALHYAARAGFTRTIAVLLAHGADPPSAGRQRAHAARLAGAFGQRQSIVQPCAACCAVTLAEFHPPPLATEPAARDRAAPGRRRHICAQAT